MLKKENRKHAEQIATLTQQLLVHTSSFSRQKMPEHTLRLLSLLPMGKMLSPTHVTDFLYEAGVLHPFMEVAHTASVLTLFCVQFMHSFAKLRQTQLSTKESLFHIKMALISACIVTSKLVELFQLYEFSPGSLWFMQGVLIPLAAYYTDVPLEEYITTYLYTPSQTPSHVKVE